MRLGPASRKGWVGTWPTNGLDTMILCVILILATNGNGLSWRLPHNGIEI